VWGRGLLLSLPRALERGSLVCPGVLGFLRLVFPRFIGQFALSFPCVPIEVRARTYDACVLPPLGESLSFGFEVGTRRARVCYAFLSSDQLPWRQSAAPPPRTADFHFSRVIRSGYLSVSPGGSRFSRFVLCGPEKFFTSATRFGFV